MGVEDTLIFPSVTLANVGLIPAVVAKDDLLVVDRLSHDSIQQAAKIAAAKAARAQGASPLLPAALEDILAKERYQGCVVAVDGVYSMTGKIPALGELDEVTRRYGGTLYVDDAHGTGVVGPGGRTAHARMILGTLRPGPDGGVAFQGVFLPGGLRHLPPSELKTDAEDASPTPLFSADRCRPPTWPPSARSCERYSFESPEDNQQMLGAATNGSSERLTDGLPLSRPGRPSAARHKSSR